MSYFHSLEVVGCGSEAQLPRLFYFDRGGGSQDIMPHNVMNNYTILSIIPLWYGRYRMKVLIITVMDWQKFYFFVLKYDSHDVQTDRLNYLG